ncbi:IS1634 family transposase [Roseinatronobacter monicus]|uniref:IS4 family transposase n=1 Tax=Roseinatronobacter monicus TaxID=393481 RepID=A0A543KBM1_9RHOB|nr:IS1634 family transposase [Roseinatronobacter monicus]TQM92456.1 IS4 family transposase [Roseinatronobacter monicus]
MYVRVSKSGNRSYLQIVEGYRDDAGRVKQKVIANLGRLDKMGEKDLSALIHGLQRAAGRPEMLPEPPKFDSSKAFGDVWVLHQLWHELGLSDALRRALRSSRRQFDAEALVRAMVFNRLIDPTSKIGVVEWLRAETSMPGIDPEAVHHMQLMRAMDALEENKDAVEQAVANQLHPLLDKDLSVVFYDVTSVRIHGTAQLEDDLRAYGQSKDIHGIGRQFALGVIQTAEGLPIAHEVFEGNVAETRTLVPILQRLQKRFALRRIVIVADRGLLSLDNVAALEELGRAQGVCVDYILAVPARRYSAFAEILREVQPALDSADGPVDQDVITETLWEERRLVIAHNAARAAEQTAARQSIIAELDALGEGLARKLDAQDAGENGRGRRSSDRGAYQRFHKALLEKQMTRFIKTDLGSPSFTYSVDEEALEQAERLDGKLLLVTSLSDMTPEEVVHRYRSLADIERGFRVLKSEIEIAPVYHRLPDRIRAHALVCFLALVLYRILRMRLRAAQSPVSPSRLLKSLGRIQKHTVHVGANAYHGITRPEPEQLDLFRTLNIELPKQPA